MNEETWSWKEGGRERRLSVFRGHENLLRGQGEPDLCEYLEKEGEAGRKVGAVIVPAPSFKREYVSIFYALCANALLPQDIDDVAMIQVDENDMGASVDAFLSHPGGNCVLIDLLDANHSIYDQRIPGVLELEGIDKLSLGKRPEGLVESAYMRLCQRLQIVEKEHRLVKYVLSQRTREDGPEFVAASDICVAALYHSVNARGERTDEEERARRKEAIVGAFLPRNKVEQANQMLSAMSFGRLDDMGLRDAGEPIEPLSWGEGLVTSVDGETVYENPHASDSFGSESFGKEWTAALVYPSIDDGEYIEHLDRMISAVTSIWTIWRKVLAQEGAEMKELTFMRYSGYDDNTRALALQEIKRIGKKYHIEAYVDAYLAGVPMEDIFA